MDLASMFTFDDATLEFCNSFSDVDMNPETSNLTSMEPLSSPEPAFGLSPVSHHGFGSDDSGFDTNLQYFNDASLLSASPGADSMESSAAHIQPLTLLSAVPTGDTTFKYILDNSVSGGGQILATATPVTIINGNTATSAVISQTGDNATLTAASTATVVPTNNGADDTTAAVESILKNEPILDIAASLTAEDMAAAELAADEVDKIPYSAKSMDGKIELKIISQPSRNHRARYRTEGSRGAVKDRSGRSFPIVKLSGYNRTPVKLRCYIGHDKRQGEPHLFYQVSKIVGKNVTNCNVTKIEGIKVIEIELTPSSNMQAVINCVGIVKERNFDVQRKATNLRKKHLYNENGDDSQGKKAAAKNGQERRSTTCTLVFGCQIPETNEILQVVSDSINCAQLLGCPEVHKISATRSHIKGGDEVFIIGKNFTRDTKIVFECEPAKWQATMEPEPEYVNQNHLIVKVPPYTGVIDKTTTDATGQVDVTFRIQCGDKASEPYLFSYMTVQNGTEQFSLSGF